MNRSPEQAQAFFATLFEAHHARVLAYALRRTSSSADAEDVAAETFIIAWRKCHQIPADALPWLYGVARRILANQRRGALRRLRLTLRLRPAEQTEERLGTDNGPAMAALARLRPDDQEVLRLVAWEGLDHAQIAHVLGVSVNAVAIRLYRARRRFEQQFAHANGGDRKDSARSRTSGSMKGNYVGDVREETR